jgi:hypothetical protein
VASISTLLNIIQFVGLIAPALAVLLELLIRFHGGIDDMTKNKRLPIEVQILMLGFVSTIIGGVVIGTRLVEKFESPVITLATGIIFMGLPLVVLSVVLFNIRLSPLASGAASFTEMISATVSLAGGIFTPVLIVGVSWVAPVYFLRGYISQNLSWGIFSSDLPILAVFGLIAVVLSYECAYLLWKEGNITGPINWDVMQPILVLQFTLLAFLLLLSLAVFIPFGILAHPQISVLSYSSGFMNIPFIWMAFLLFVIVVMDPSVEDGELTFDS